jgi:two-component system cell cycle response regulator DivK
MDGPLILLVEDDDASQEIFCAALRHFGYEVHTARVAEEGLRILRSRPVDAVIVDIGLPGTNGFELIEQIRADAATARLPVVVCTVHVFAEDQERARVAGCDVFLLKPIEPMALGATMRALLGQPEPTAS